MMQAAAGNVALKEVPICIYIYMHTGCAYSREEEEV